MKRLPAAALLLGFAVCAAAGCAERDKVPAAASGPAGPENWPIYRGDRALSGNAGGMPDCPMSVRWRFKTGGAVNSSPVVAGDAVFFGSDDGNVYAVRLADGGELWRFATEGAVTAPPLVVDGAVVVGSTDSFVYCLDAADGSPRWKFETGGEINGSANWFARDGASTQPGDGAGTQVCVLVGSYDSKLHCLDLASGQGLWAFEAGSFINGAPAVWEPREPDGGARIVLGSCDANLYVLTGAGQETARIDTGRYVPASPALADGLAYAGNYADSIVCADLENGRLVWTYQGQNAFVSSPAVGLREVLAGSEDRRVHCVNRSDGSRRWTFKTGGTVESSPVICGDKAVFGSQDGRLYVVTLNEGKEVWSHKLGDGISSSAAIGGELVLIGCDDGYLYAFGKAK